MVFINIRFKIGLKAAMKQLFFTLAVLSDVLQFPIFSHTIIILSTSFLANTIAGASFAERGDFILYC